MLTNKNRNIQCFIVMWHFLLYRTFFFECHVLKFNPHEIIHLALVLCTFLSFTGCPSPLPRHALSSPHMWWTCWGSSPVHGPWLHGRLSAWWASSTASSARSRPSWSRALVRQSWSWGPVSLMQGRHVVVVVFKKEYCTESHMNKSFVYQVIIPVGLHCGSKTSQRLQPHLNLEDSSCSQHRLLAVIVSNSKSILINAKITYS